MIRVGGTEVRGGNPPFPRVLYETLNYLNGQLHSSESSYSSIAGKPGSTTNTGY